MSPLADWEAALLAQKEAAAVEARFIKLERREPRGALEYLAQRLRAGTPPEVIAIALDVVAEELEGVGWP